MPQLYYRFTCQDCHRTWSVQSTSRPATQPCAVCKGSTRVRQLHSLRSPKDLDLQDSIATRRAAGLDQRVAARRAAEAMERRRSEFGYDGDDDDLYAPAPGFTPSMRLTDVGVTTRANPTHLRSFSTAWTRVREPRSVTNPTEQRAPQQVMGLAKGKVGPLAATAWAAENALHGATDPEFEWCHLIADCLGGPTAADNLVAAGKHANTYMMYIEMACKGRTGLEVQIEVLLSADHVAELIKYRIRKARGTATRIEETIDSRSAGFSRADRDALTSRIKNKIDAWSPRK